MGFRPTSLCLPSPPAFPYHFPVFLLLAWHFGQTELPHFLLQPLNQAVSLPNRSFLVLRPCPLFQAQLSKPFQVSQTSCNLFFNSGSCFGAFLQAIPCVWYSFVSPSHWHSTPCLWVQSALKTVQYSSGARDSTSWCVTKAGPWWCVESPPAPLQWPKGSLPSGPKHHRHLWCDLWLFRKMREE